jgi:methyl-accepting chemotaxis protein
VDEVRRDDLCAFGQWLMGDAALREAPLYADVLALHARFHLEAARVLHIALEGRAQEAAAAMEPGSDFDEASSALVAALAAWRAAG